MMMYNESKKYENILSELDKYKIKDFTFKSGKIIGSMCTQPHEIAIQAYVKFLDTNLGDPELFPGTKEIEDSLKKYILKLLNAPKSAGGVVVSGGTEGNITAMWLAKEISKKNEIIIPKSAHFSFEKIASIMSMKLIPLDLTKDFVVDINNLKKNINKNTAAVIGIAGSTELGTIDPIPELSDICYNENIFLHVDAAFGGYVIPFLKELGYNVPEFDFKLKGVSSISIDSHKMGYSAIPLGLLTVRDKNWFDRISVISHCINSQIQIGVLGTRSGGPVAAAYAVYKLLGRNGYKKLIESCMNLTHYTKKEIEKSGLKLIVEPEMNVLAIEINKLDEVYNKLSDLGWKVNKIDRISSLRVVIMPHIKKETIDQFIEALKHVCIDIGEI